MSLDSQTRSEAELQQLLESAEKDCRHDRSSQAFRDALIRQLMNRSASACVRLWEVRGEEAVQCVVTAGVPAETPSDSDLQHAAVGIVDDLSGRAVGDTSSTQHLLTATVVIDGLHLILEVVAPAGDVRHDLLVSICDVLGDLHRRMLLQKLVTREDRVYRSGDVISLLHADLDPDRIANTVASDLAGVFDCRRVSVCRRRFGSGWDVVAATAVGHPNDRSDAVRAVCDAVRLAEQEAAKTDSPSDARTSQSHPRAFRMADGVSAIVRPLTPGLSWQDCRWAVVLECDDPATLDRQLADWVCRHAAAAFRNSERLAASSLTGRLRRLPGALLKRRPLITLAAAVVLLAIGLATPTELRIEAYGRVQPVDRIRIFTPDAGIITSVLAEDGMTVVIDQELCQLRNEDVELELETVTGELASSRARLAALESMRGTTSGDRSLLRSGEEAELTAAVASLERQRAILQARQAALTVRSPLSGRVYGHVLDEYLEGRPVQRGQYLFDVADPQSAWQLELQIPEDDVRHVLAAMNDAAGSPQITYTIETSPETRLETRLHDLSDSVQVGDRGRLSTRATARLDNAHGAADRPGAGVIAWIHCGRHARGYVYFRRVIEFVQRQLLL